MHVTKKGLIARDCPEKKITVKESTGANPKPAFKCANNIAQDREQEIEARRKKCEIVGLVNGTPVSIQLQLNSTLFISIKTKHQTTLNKENRMEE